MASTVWSPGTMVVRMVEWLEAPGASAVKATGVSSSRVPAFQVTAPLTVSRPWFW